jgi:hypothetical protein
MSECCSATSHFTATDASMTMPSSLLAGTAAIPAAIALGTNHGGAVGMEASPRFIAQAATALREALTTLAQGCLQNCAMFGFGRSRVALRALLQQSHQFVIEFSHKQGRHDLGAIIDDSMSIL